MSTDIRRMFDEIAPTYDLLNHVLSFGLDFLWRRKAISSMRDKAGERILDLAAGTGDFSIAALGMLPAHIVATDFAFKMLEIAKKKFELTASRKGSTMDVGAADATRLPFKDQSFDVVLIGFGIRNIPGMRTALREMHRVLRAEGRLCILELSRPHVPIFAQVFGWYFHYIVPIIGELLSGYHSPYRYLPESVDAFPAPSEIIVMIRDAGFHDASFMPLTFGAATLLTARK